MRKNPSVTPTVNPNWTAEKITEQLAEPKKLADGTSITKRTSQIVNTAKAPLEHQLRDTLVLSAKLPYLNGWAEARRRNAEFYNAAFANHAAIQTPVVLDETRGDTMVIEHSNLAKTA